MKKLIPPSKIFSPEVGGNMNKNVFTQVITEKKYLDKYSNSIVYKYGYKITYDWQNDSCKI